MSENRHPELKLTEEEARARLSRQSRRGFLVGGAAAVAGVGLYRWVTGSKPDNGIPGLERRGLEANARMAEAYLSNQHRMAEFPRSQVGGVKPNGDIGLDSDLDPSAWKMEVTSTSSDRKWSPSLADIQALPKVEMTTRFCCIEGWSGVSHWAGARFADFTDAYFSRTSTRVTEYVYMATADEEYYVGLDMKSALHPQTLLAYEQDGKPLEARRGAPLRLVIPVKYGIKNIKRIGQIQYTHDKPDDYWAEEGYDWFAGL